MSETIEIREGENFDLQAAERYLRAHVEDVPEGELEVSQFPSGASNLTYLLKVGDWEGVLRRPPLGPVPPKAHDMGRESSILARLNAVYPLAPKPYFFCEDESVIGGSVRSSTGRWRPSGTRSSTSPSRSPTGSNPAIPTSLRQSCRP